MCDEHFGPFFFLLSSPFLPSSPLLIELVLQADTPGALWMSGWIEWLVGSFMTQSRLKVWAQQGLPLLHRCPVAHRPWWLSVRDLALNGLVPPHEKVESRRQRSGGQACGRKQRSVPRSRISYNFGGCSPRNPLLCGIIAGCSPLIGDRNIDMYLLSCLFRIKRWH